MKKAFLPGLILAVAVSCGTAADSVDPLAASLPWRTALHHDASLEEPLERLVAVWREAGRLDDLVAMYRQHCQTYRQDAGAWAVGARILVAIGSTDIDSWLDRALAACPEDAYLHVLLAEHRERRGLAGRGEALQKAVAAATDPARKRSYARLLLRHLAVAGDSDAMLAARDAFRAAGPTDVDAELRLIEELIDLGQRDLAMGWLEELHPGAAELQVERDVLLARCRNEAGRHEAAAALLDDLLARLDHVYWRRAEIMQRRLAMVTGPEEREAMLARLQEAVDASPAAEGAWLDLATAQQHFGRGGEAVRILKEAAAALPHSVAVEEACIEAMQRRGDYAGLEVWLAERLDAAPDRLDLAEQRVALLFTLERTDEARAAWQTLVTRLDTATANERQLLLARRLARIGLDDDARALLQGVCAAQPARLDLLRELLEIEDQTGRSRLLVNDRLTVDAAGEHARDLARWLQENGYVDEARLVLSHQLERTDTTRTRSLLLRSLVDLGDLRAAERELAVLRERVEHLADYQRWLESAELVHAGDPDLLWRELSSQQAAILDGEPEADERAVAVVERLAQDADQAERLLAWLEVQMPAWPDGSRARLRRIQVDTLARRADKSGALIGALAALAEEDDAQADDLAVRRLSLQLAREQDMEIDDALLGGIVWERVRDVTALSRLAASLHRRDPALATVVYKRLVEIEPDNHRAWQGWLNCLHESDDLKGFARAVRRCLASPDLELTPALRRGLARSMRDVLWVAIGQGLAWGNMESGELRMLLNEVETLRRPDDRHWLAWARLRLARLDRDPVAANEARAALLAVVADGQGIDLPDGTWCSAAEVQRLMDLQAEPAIAPPAPQPPYRLRWARRGHGVVGAIGDVLICNDHGTLVALERSSGRQRWHRTAGNGMVLPVCVDQRLLITATEDGRVLADDVSGERVWEAQIEDRIGGLAAAEAGLVVSVGKGSLILLDATSGRRLRRIDPPVRERDEDDTDLAGIFADYQRHEAFVLPQPLAVDGNRVFIGGIYPRIIDLDDASVSWDFTRLRRSKDQVELQERPSWMGRPIGPSYGRRRGEPLYYYLNGSRHQRGQGEPVLLNDVATNLMRSVNTWGSIRLLHDSIVFQSDGEVAVVRTGLPPSGAFRYRIDGRWLGMWRNGHLLLDLDSVDDEGQLNGVVRLVDRDGNRVVAGQVAGACLHNNQLICVGRQGVRVIAPGHGGDLAFWPFDAVARQQIGDSFDQAGAVEDLSIECQVVGDLLMLRIGTTLLALEHADG